MKWLKNLLKEVALTLVLQLVTNHNMRTAINRADFIFVGTVAGGYSIMALLIAKLIYRDRSQ